ncbi:hypothetical protein JI750_12105 [Flavobacterium sp. GN10]|uniref:Uncharacterized protein n=1 Tax=Flavobacterium tagetis TaxID=2801336 RepID=A0ABS1KDS1_9FLAO|nr:hypothetical protein [Flavobacterium tagetis]MBL0737639.1 hypothetical protein [Flavobacterium tagetis]
MTLADLIKDFIDSTKERLKTPISGAFLWSFVIYNWRPILMLLFSDTTIENKIIVINHEYCSFWAIFWPLVIATAYTLLIPKIMLQIDNDLADTKQERITRRYEIKKHEVKEKTEVAKEEFLLKSEESGNKTIQELNDQIKGLEEKNISLQESVIQIQDSSKATIDRLNSELKTATDTVRALQRSRKDVNYIDDLGRLKKGIVIETLHLEPAIAKSIQTAVDQLTLEEFVFLRDSLFTKAGRLAEENNNDVKPEFLMTLSDKKVLKLDRSPNGSFIANLTTIGLAIRNEIKSL